MLSLSARWVFLFFLSLLTTLAGAQGPPQVPNEITFAGVSVYLTAPGQQRVQQEMARLYTNQTDLRNNIELMRNIDSVLEPMLEEHNVPTDFRYACLPMQPNGGYWGLDATKASQLQLRVDNIVDERLNLSSASDAVLAELTLLLPKRANWMHTLVGFMQGQRSMTITSPSAITAASLTKNTIQLGLETPDAIWTVLARKLVFERESPLIRPTDQFLLYDYRQGRGKSLGAISAELGVEQTRFLPFNNWLKARLIPTDKTYPVLIRLTPSEYIAVKSQINAGLQATSQPTPQQNSSRRDIGFPVVRRLPVAPSNDPLTRATAIFYEINGRKGIQAQSCDNIITLAYYGGLPIDRFVQINDLSERDLVRAGELYYLEMKDRRAKVPFHVVQSGQTLRDISNMYGVRLNSLLKFNRMEANQRVQPGRIIWMQQKRPSSQPVEYQKMPDIFPDPEPPLAKRKLTREDEESPVDSPTPPDWKLINPDSAQRAVSMRMSMLPPPASRPADASLEIPSATGFTFHTVKTGDTHSSVAERYKLKLPDLIAWNNLSLRKPLTVGTQLIVGKPELTTSGNNTASTRPQPADPTAVPSTRNTTTDVGFTPTPASSATATMSLPPTRPVVPPTNPDTRPVASSRSRGDVDMLIDVEGKRPAPPVSTSTSSVKSPSGKSTIRVQPSKGVITTVQVDAPKPTAQPESPKATGNELYHVVQPGQTVYRVALINKVTVADVMKWNGLKNFNIEVGQRLVIRK